MELQRIVVAHFSPTGGTKKVAQALQNGFTEGVEGLECQVVPFNFLSPTIRAKRVPKFTEHDLLIFAYPVFFGRMPWAFENWPELVGNGAKAIVVSVYGNRAIEDAARETMSFLSNHGFKVLGHIEAIAQHSQESTLAAHRPDDEDVVELKSFAQRILQTIKDQGFDSLKEYEFDRTTPLKAPGKAPCVPFITDADNCDQCLRCVSACPCGIIDKDTISVKDEDLALCMGCRACMNVCKNCTRGFPQKVHQAIAERMAMIKAANSERKPNVLSLAP